MKRSLLTTIAIILAGAAISQELKQVTIKGGKSFLHFGILVDRVVMIRIADNGKILEYGLEEQSMRNPNYYATKLQPYLGRVDIYGPEADSLARGKVKSIGTAQITYYPSYDDEHRRGKIRTIGNLMFSYYDYRDTDTQRGKLKQIGRSAIDFYPSYENEAVRGKLKTVGENNISYYTIFDDKAIAGKVKMIGSHPYTWYTSLERQGMAGVLKSGAQRLQVGQVTYVVQ